MQLTLGHCGHDAPDPPDSRGRRRRRRPAARGGRPSRPRGRGGAAVAHHALPALRRTEAAAHQARSGPARRPRPSRPRGALLAIDPVTGEGVAVARYVRLPGEGDVAEIAITVVDAWQGRGVGTALTRVLIERAREEGLRRLRAVTLGENRRSQNMLRRDGFTAVG